MQTTTNCDSVELSVNNTSLGTRKTSDFPNNTIEWDVPYAKGEMVAKGYKAGKQAASYELRSAGEPAQILLSADRQQIAADGQDLSHIGVKLVDAQGVVVPNADLQITVEVVGPGRLLGLDTGDLRRNSFTGNSIRTYFGRALITVQSSRSKGNIKVIVKVPGVPDTSLQIASQ